MKRLMSFFCFFLASSIHARVLPMEAFTFQFNIKTINVPLIKKEKIHHSVEILRQIFSSAEFREEILNHEFQGERSFHMNRGLSNLEIYHLILSGMENLYPYDNNSMDVEIELYSDYESNVLGFTRPDTHRIWMNRKYFNQHSHGELASNLVHEWLHKLGFEHEKEKSAQRRYSVPYAIGYIIKELAKRYEE